MDALDTGLDLEMPGDTVWRGSLTKHSVSTNLVKVSTITTRARKVLEFIERASKIPVSKKESERDLPEDRNLNKRLAQDSIVLAKNEGSLLPIPETFKGKLALIGSHMKDSSVNSSGATALEPYYTIHPFEAIKGKLGPEVEIAYEIGAFAHKMMPLFDGRSVANLHLRLFNQAPWATPEATLVGNIDMRKTFFQLLDYVNPDLNNDLFYAQMEGDFTPDESGEWEFAVAVHGIARLYLDDELVIDQFTKQERGDSFFGRGSVEKKAVYVVEADKTYRLRLDFGNAAQSPLDSKANGDIEFQAGGARLGGCRKLAPEEATERAVAAAVDADYAIICTGLSVSDFCHNRCLPSLPKVTVPSANGRPRASTVNQWISRRM